MNYALSTLGQGATSYIQVPNWIRGSGADWQVGVTFKLFDLAANRHILGRSSSTAGSVRALTDGSMRYRDSGVDVATSAAGFIVPGNFYTAVLQRVGSLIEFWIGPESMDSSLVGGTFVGSTTAVSSQILNPLDQIGRFSASTRNDIEVKKFWTTGGTYDSRFDETSSVGTGVNWPSTTADRNLTIANATGAADSWWVSYGGAAPVDLSISAGLPQLSANASFSNAVPVYGFTVSAGLPALTAAATLTDAVPSFSAALAAGLPVPLASALFSDAVPAFTAAIAAGMPNLTGSAAFSINYGQIDIAVSAGLPQLTASTEFADTTPSYNAAIVAGLPALTIAAEIVVTTPGGVSFSVSAGLPALTGQVAFASNVPEYTAQIAAGLPSLTASATFSLAALTTVIKAGLPQLTSAAVFGSSIPELFFAIDAGLPQLTASASFVIPQLNLVISFSEGALVEYQEPARFVEIQYEERFAQL